MVLVGVDLVVAVVVVVVTCRQMHGGTIECRHNHGMP